MGVSYMAMEVECPNGHEWIQRVEYERDVNAYNVLDDTDCCPVCGEDPIDGGSEVEDEGPDPDRFRDDW